MRGTRLFCGAATALAVGFVPNFANAASEQRWIEEVVVTAQKREADIQDVTLSVSAISGEQLEREQITSIDDLQFSVPGVTFSTFSANAQLTIRGSGAEDLNVGGDGGSGFHLDGVYQGRPFLLNQGFFDVERVEVLRGPQGTLLGRNTTGGSVNVITRQPVLDEFTVNGDVTLGNYDAVAVRSAINLPLVDGKLAARVAVVDESRDGWLKNLTRNEYQEDADSRGVRGHLLFTPNDSIDITLSGYSYKSRSTGPIRQTPVDISAVSGAAPEPKDLRKVRSDGMAPGGRADMSDVGVDLDVEGATATIDWSIDQYTVRSITSYFRGHSEGDTDADETELSLQYSTRTDTAKQYSQELQLISDLDGPFNFVAGLFAYSEDSILELDSVRAIRDADGNVTGTLSTIIDDHTVETESYAVFGEGYYNITDKLRFTLGGRFSKDKKTGKGLPLIGSVTELDDDWIEFTPRGGLDYSFSDDVMAYLMISKGYKSGGMNTVPAFDSYDPETLWSYEVGVKSELWDGRARLNASAFYNDVQDQHFFRAIPNVTLGFTVDNAGASTIQGIEVEGLVVVTENLTLEGNFAWLDAEFDKFITDDPGTPADPSLISLAGNTLPRSPEYTATVAAQHTVDLAGGRSVTTRLQYRYQSEIWFSHFNELQLYSKEDDYGKADAFVTLEDESVGWYIQAFVKNLTDKDTVANAFRNQSLFPLQNQSFHYASPPRTYGITIGMSLARE